ncbi:MAG: hypothetical protein AAGI03_02700 [Pseudomonadota bacterium]
MRLLGLIVELLLLVVVMLGLIGALIWIGFTSEQIKAAAFDDPSALLSVEALSFFALAAVVVSAALLWHRYTR